MEGFLYHEKYWEMEGFLYHEKYRKIGGFLEILITLKSTGIWRTFLKKIFTLKSAGKDY